MFPVPNNVLYGRMMVWLESARNDGVHWTMIQAEGRSPAKPTPACIVNRGRRCCTAGRPRHRSAFVKVGTRAEVYGLIHVSLRLMWRLALLGLSALALCGCITDMSNTTKPPGDLAAYTPFALVPKVAAYAGKAPKLVKMSALRVPANGKIPFRRVGHSKCEKEGGGA